MSLRKPAPPKQKFFFPVQTTRLAESFDTSTRSVNHTGPEKFSRKDTCDPAVICKQLELTRMGAKVLRTHWFETKKILSFGFGVFGC